MFTFVVLFASFAVLAVTILHALIGNWSGAASLGNFAALLFGVPFLSVRAWQLRGLRKQGFPASWFWFACAAFPVVFLSFWVVATIFFRLA